MNRVFQYIMLIFLLALSCVDPYWPNLEGEGDVLVVDGLVTDDPDNQYVRLSFSAPANDQEYIPVSNALVTVTDDLGQTVIFHETDNGNYYPDNFAGVAGRKYSLSVSLPGGKHYSSDFQPLTLSETFDSIYYVLESQPTTDPEYNIEGVRFYINNIPSAHQEKYYLFQLVETYKFHVEFVLKYIEAGNGLIEITDPPPTLCYKTTNIYGFYIFKSKPDVNPMSQTLPLHFVPFDTKQLYERYSLQVKQVTISEEVFNLFYRVNQQSNSGSLYTIQPYNIIGNIKCDNDNNETVLGCFIVGGLSKKRKYFNRPENVRFTFTICQGQTEGAGLLVMRGGSPNVPLHFTLIDGALAFAQPKCFFCSENDATTEKPDFWED